MDLKTYLRNLPKEEREPFAERCGTSLNYLKLVAYKAKIPAEKLCIEVERESNGSVRCEDLRDDVDWGFLRGSDRRATERRAHLEQRKEDRREGDRRANPGGA